MKEEARTAILEAAEQVMTEQGLTAPRMEDIAARVGVSVGTLYNYFEDRRGLFLALREARAQQLLAVLDAELARGRGAPYRERLEGLLRATLEHTQQHFRLFTVILEDSRREASPGEELAHHRRQWNGLVERVGALSAEGIAQGVLRPEDAAHYPTLLLGMLQSLVLRQLLEHRSLPIDEQLALLSRCFLEGASPRSR